MIRDGVTTLYSTETVGTLRSVLTTSTVATSQPDLRDNGFPGVAELTELPRFNIHLEREAVREEQQHHQQEEEEEEEEEEDIVSSEAFRKCSIMILKSIILNPYHERS